MKIKKVNQDERNWEPAAHEDPEDPGVWKKVIVKHDEVDPQSKLMMINLCKVPVDKTHKAHSHETMEEIFYFTDGVGEVRINDEFVEVSAGDRIIIPAKSVHQVKNTGKDELLYIGLGIALD
ncbi:MAG: cupin domain-containing protein [Candidatus Curtissbacteria bacterium]